MAPGKSWWCPYDLSVPTEDPITFVKQTQHVLSIARVREQRLVKAHGEEFDMYLEDGCVTLACMEFLSIGHDVGASAPLPRGRDLEALERGCRTYTRGERATAFFQRVKGGVHVTMDVCIHPSEVNALRHDASHHHSDIVRDMRDMRERLLKLADLSDHHQFLVSRVFKTRVF